MAGLTVISDIEPYWAEWRGEGILVAKFSGVGTDATTVKGEAAAGSVWVTTGGRVSAGGAGSFLIMSASNDSGTTTELDRIEFVSRATAEIPAGVQTSDNRGLSVRNSDISGRLNGWIAYKNVKLGESVPQLHDID